VTFVAKEQIIARTTTQQIRISKPNQTIITVATVKTVATIATDRKVIP
jgi:hypothetical protein